MRYRPALRMLVYLAGLLILAASWLPATADAAPTLTLEPASGPCATDNPPITLRGSGFTPGATVRFGILRERDRSITAASSATWRTAAADGTYEHTIPLFGCSPAEPAGSIFTIGVVEYHPGASDPRGPSATATFTVTTATTGATATPGPAATATAVPSAALPGLPNTGAGGMIGQPWLWGLSLGLLLLLPLGGAYVAQRRA